MYCCSDVYSFCNNKKMSFSSQRDCSVGYSHLSCVKRFVSLSTRTISKEGEAGWETPASFGGSEADLHARKLTNYMDTTNRRVRGMA